MEELGRAIAKVRKAKGLSLRAVAAQVGLSYQVVLNAERGLSRLENAAKIAKALGMQPSALIAAQSDFRRLLRAS